MKRRRRLDEVWLYFGWDDSVVWYGAPVPYEDSGLSEELVAALRRWGSEMRRLSRDGQPESPTETARLGTEAVALAHRLAAEIGPEFSVLVTTSRRPKRIHHDGAAVSPDASAVFEKLREREIEWGESVRRALADGSPLHWSSTRDPETP